MAARGGAVVLALTLAALAWISFEQKIDDGTLPSLAVEPMNGRAAAMLGVARYRQGDAAAGEASFRVAAGAGWRDPLTQSYWLVESANAGDWDGAAQRLDALLRTDWTDPVRQAALARFELTPEGRAALAVRLAQKPAWSAPYFTDVAEHPRENRAARTDVAQRLKAIEREDQDNRPPTT